MIASTISYELRILDQYIYVYLRILTTYISIILHHNTLNLFLAQVLQSIYVPHRDELCHGMVYYFGTTISLQISY